MGEWEVFMVNIKYSRIRKSKRKHGESFLLPTMPILSTLPKLVSVGEIHIMYLEVYIIWLY